jgi:flavin reductase (DIM6/NTAB) family NADH-FMN oxidoreductase RutF
MSTSSTLTQSPVTIVTGASRGAGRGIAVALGKHGCTVYVTGRSEKTGDANLPGTIYETAEAVTAAGGCGIAVKVDHADDTQVHALFEQVEREQGRLDILVNNVCAIYDEGLNMHTEIEPAILYFGTPVALISTDNEDGSINVAPNSSLFWLGWSCMMGIDASSKTTENLKRTKSCVINLPSFAQAEQINALSLYTGSNPVPTHKYFLGYKYKKDKLKDVNLDAEPANTVSGARIMQCPIQLEAEVMDIHSFGKFDRKMAVPVLTFELRIKLVHAESSITLENDINKIDPLKWNPLIMCFRRFFGLSEAEARSNLFSGDESLYAPWKIRGLVGLITRAALRLSRQ